MEDAYGRGVTKNKHEVEYARARAKTQTEAYGAMSESETAGDNDLLCRQCKKNFETALRRGLHSLGINIEENDDIAIKTEP